MPASTNEQYDFLISCIRYSDNGKIDFTEVAKECNIVTKGAAAKRYERLMKAHNLHQPRETNKRARSKSPKRTLTPPATPSPPKRRRKATNPAKPSKKAITPPIQTRDSDDDDEEFPPLESIMPANIKPERRSSFAHVKPEPAATTIKQEQEETQPDKPAGEDAIVEENPIIIDPTVTHVEQSASQSTEERSSDVEHAGVGEFEKRWIELRGEDDGIVVLDE